MFRATSQGGTARVVGLRRGRARRRFGHPASGTIPAPPIAAGCLRRLGETTIVCRGGGKTRHELHAILGDMDTALIIATTSPEASKTPRSRKRKFRKACRGRAREAADRLLCVLVWPMVSYESALEARPQSMASRTHCSRRRHCYAKSASGGSRCMLPRRPVRTLAFPLPSTSGKQLLVVDPGIPCFGRFGRA